MAFEPRVIRVLVSSPGDCDEEREGMVAEMNAWNLIYSEKTGIFLWAWLWETCSYANHGRRGQLELRRQLVDKADLCVAFVRHKLGSGGSKETGPAEGRSGTVEEIDGCVERGLHPAVHFLDEVSPDLSEANRIDAYKRRIQENEDYYTMKYRTPAEGVRMAMTSLEAQVMAMTEFEVMASRAVFDKKAEDPVAVAADTEPDKNPAPRANGNGKGKTVKVEDHEIYLPSGNKTTVKANQLALERLKDIDVEWLERETNQEIMSRLRNLREALKDTPQLVNETQQLMARNHMRNLLKNSLNFDAVAETDWTFAVNDEHSGWVLTNTSRLPILLAEYVVLAPRVGSQASRTLIESEEARNLDPGEKKFIDAGDVTEAELCSARIELTYRSANDQHLIMGTVNCEQGPTVVRD